ncbi:allantoicase [Pacificitalea manganoxidans]|uniref:Probable allantoicase n=1 Tax=Pacificitalea manganoxidans TaxID=1411902 RepID=A0A291LWE1_9RHOB|nr:allantoicase [Pacificitalea manganoxidans]ATI40808.1 allantoicase [Pacificitalea manganoxidans]MBF53866.1 allantoicase [Actibacterium sp.]MDR6309818.1 allantoicase [Pacificitalea manganoxidans]OWU69588.1 allantoicase [Roseovarius sp. 22II1-1F6A]|tara:strand:+ start:461 stop:1480 length:1020 start_codon:yes stop_codon:yes gene_type:complete
MTTIENIRADIPLFARTGINLASAGLGAQAVSASNEFFAPLERMLQDNAPVFIPDKFDDNGKWMDGWETQRRRDGGHDHAVIKLAAPGRILGFNLDTSHFTGNYAPACKIEAAHELGATEEDTNWVQILPHKALSASAEHYFSCDSFESWQYLRLHIYPDGGIARLRVYGVPELDDSSDGEIDLVAALNGGRILAFSDAHYGDYMRLLAPGRGINMGDGWETRRRREPGYDWMVLALGARGVIEKALVDTCHFKGNYPDRCSIQVADMRNFGDGLTDALVTDSMFWKTLLPETRLQADHEHLFTELADFGPATHVRFNMFPDGGVSRLRLFGRPVGRPD